MRVLIIILFVPFICFPQYKSTISGNIVGADGLPLLMAHVGISGGAGWEEVHLDTEDKIFSSTLVNHDGSFSISTDSLGALRLWCMGVGYKLLTIPILLEHPTHVELTIKLEPLHFAPNPDGIEINYDFDDVAGGKYAILKETSAQIYEAVISTKKKELRYRIKSMIDHPNGISVSYASHDRFEYYMEGMYTTIVHPKGGKVTIRVDCSMAGRNEVCPSFVFKDTQSVQARFASYYCRSLEMKERYNKALHDYLAEGKKFDRFVFDWGPYVTQLKRDLECEQDQNIADELVIEYLEMAILSKDGIFSNELAAIEKYVNPREVNKTVGNKSVRKTLSGISAQSPVWVFHRAIALQAGKYHPLGNAYVEKIIQTHPSRSFRGYLTFRKFTYLDGEGNNSERERLFLKLVNDFAETPAGNWVKRNIIFEEQLKIGSPLPVFLFKDLENKANTFTNDMFRGKYFLLGFWATWCGASVEEIPFLEKAYKKYHPYGFEVLSVSYEKSSVVKYFRSTRYAMPWHHSVVDESEQGDVQQRFSVCDPKTILVGPDGVVLEIYNGFSSDIDYEAILAKYLTNR